MYIIDSNVKNDVVNSSFGLSISVYFDIEKPCFLGMAMYSANRYVIFFKIRKAMCPKENNKLNVPNRDMKA